MKYIITALFLFAFTISAIGYQAAHAATVSLDELEAGDLFRGETFSAVYYYGSDGFRYVFPNSSTYNTWYDNFDSVKFISDTDLGKIQIGGNVTYKPGSKMIKINTDPKTYAVAEGGTLRHVGSEDLAVALYGDSWNTMIDDVADAFFSNYTIGDEIEDAADYDVDETMDSVDSINDDKGLVAPADVEIDASGFSDEEVTIDAGQTVRWTNTDSEKHSVTADDLSWGSGTMQEDGFWVRRFEEEGTYTYYDSYDSSNTGAIVVQDSDE